eukprot:CAMPEP_0172662086 /NCGR_PEP_ID=MMETSP1074-20121228/5142_1 /TAXON_ID=2916 /ORGANISM="Ceratium fusus, Strain PA161109" /LENGTH=38 /DNA_ID= /DNA_START= /DNA_END= /DNA_ORIENTATION=
MTLSERSDQLAQTLKSGPVKQQALLAVPATASQPAVVA